MAILKLFESVIDKVPLTYEFHSHMLLRIFYTTVERNGINFLN